MLRRCDGLTAYPARPLTPFDAEALVGVLGEGAVDAFAGVFARGAAARGFVPGFKICDCEK